jgi:hypothetical protein
MLWQLHEAIIRTYEHDSVGVVEGLRLAGCITDDDAKFVKDFIPDVYKNKENQHG